MPADITKKFDRKKVMKEFNALGVMEKRNVTVAYPGTKKVKGKDTREPCIVVGVHDKMHKSLLRENDLIPKKLPSGVKTDVVVKGRIVPLNRTVPVTPAGWVDPYDYWYDSYYFSSYESQIENDDPNCAGTNMYGAGDLGSLTFQWDYGCPLHAWKHRPLVGGISIGTYWYEGYDPVLGDVWDEKSNGTLCAIVRDKVDGKLVMLSNNHVFTRSLAYYDTNYSVPSGGEQSIQPDTYVTQPGWIDYNYWYRISEQTYAALGYEPSGAWTPAERAVRDAFFQDIICGEVKRMVPIQFGTDSDQNNLADCAIASIDPSMAYPYHGIFKAHVGPYPFASKDEYASGDVVYISSRTTGYKSPDDTVAPYILSTDTIINVQYASGDSGIAKFTDQIMVTSEESNVVRSGDSGSPLLVYAGNIFKLAGLLFAGDTDYDNLYANHMADVADEMNIEWWDGKIIATPSAYAVDFEDTCYHKIKTVKKAVTHEPDYLYGNCEECENPVTFSFADEYGAEIINSVWKVPVKGETTIEKTIYLWFDKEDPQDRTPKDDCTAGQYKITNVRVSVANLGGTFTGGTDEQGQECVDEKWISIRSDGVRTHYCDEMVDDNQSTFKSIGGGFTNAADYLALGDFCADSARRLFIKVTVPEGCSSEGAVFPKLVVQYNVENESSSSESSSSSFSSLSSSSSSVSSSSESSSESKSSSLSSSESKSLSSSLSSSSSSESSSSSSSDSSSSESSSSSSESTSSSSSSSESVISSSSSSESSESSSESSESSWSSSSAESKSSSSSSSSLSESKSSSSSSSESSSSESSSSSSESKSSSSSSSESVSSSSSTSESSSESSSSESSLSSSSSDASPSSSSVGAESGTFYPAATADDGWARSSGASFDNSTTPIYVGNWGGVSSFVFIRFPSVTIPQGAVIQSAYVKLTGYAADSGTTVNLNCGFHDVDDVAAGDIDSAGEIVAASLTTIVAWNNLSSWANGGQYDSPDLTDSLQDVIDRVGWESGNALCLQLRDNASSDGRRMSGYEFGAGSEKAELHVEWTV